MPITVCEGPDCSEEIIIIGDGTNVTRSDSQGGHYFCSEECAQNWEIEKAYGAPELEGHGNEAHFPPGYEHKGGPPLKY